MHKAVLPSYLPDIISAQTLFEQTSVTFHQLTSTQHLLIVIAAVVITLAVLATVSLGRITSQHHSIALTLTTYTLTTAGSPAWQTVVCPGNTIDTIITCFISQSITTILLPWQVVRTAQ